MAGNTTTKKEYSGIADAQKSAESPKGVNYPNKGGSYKGEIGKPGPFAKPAWEVSPQIGGINGTHNDIGELSGFITDGYLDKAGIPYGEGAKFNFLPPGMDIDNQVNAEIHQMPLRKLTAESYPGDGWMPAPRDLPE